MRLARKIDEEFIPPILRRYNNYMKIRLSSATRENRLYALVILNEFMQQRQLKPLEQIGRIDIELFMGELTSRKEKKEIIQATVKHMSVHVRIFAQWLTDEGLIQVQEFYRIERDLELIPGGDTGEDNREALHKDEEIQVFRNLLDLLFRMLVWTGVNFGLRRLEYCNLRIPHLELDRDEPRLKVELSKGRKKKTRYIPLFPGQVKQWKTWLLYRKSLNLAHDFVFYNPRDPSIGLTRNTAGYVFAKIAKITGVKLYAHRLRYTYAVRLWENKVDIYTISRALGHSKVETTIRYLKVPERDFFKKFMESAHGLFF